MAKLSVDKALLKAKSHTKKGEIEEAQKLYQAVLQAFPKNKRAQQGLAALSKPKQSSATQGPPQEEINQLINLYNQGQLVVAAEQAQALTVQYPEAFIVWNILGAAHNGLGKTVEASAAFKKVTELNPIYADGFNNFGVTLKEQGKLEEALEAYNKALALKPDYADAYNNMGNALKEQGKLEEALEAYNKALSLKPDYADAYNNMGNAFAELGKLEETIEAYNKALSLKPDYESARAAKLLHLAQICDWDNIAEDIALIPELGTSERHISPFALLTLEDAPTRHLTRSAVYAKFKYLQEALPLPAVPTKKPKRIRIGYFSADFKEHPVAHLIAKVFELHNRDRFEVFGYSLHSNKHSKMRQRLVKSFDRFLDVQGMSDKDVALQARQDGIDIAIDLNGYTLNSRTGIFSYRAAPIQINYLGYPGSLGADFIDYIIADQHLIPPKNQKYFSEKQIYLPDTYIPTDNTLPFSSEPSSRSDLGLPDSGFVFCAINNTYKINKPMFDIWMRLLQTLSGSVLWLFESNKIAKANLIKEAKKRGVTSDRLVFAKIVSHEKYLSQFRQADLFLDTSPYNSGATASNALWAGLPVITKIGQSYTARMAGSMLNAVGLPELITETEQDYEALILKLATNSDKLADIKKKLARNRLVKPLFDTEQYTKHLEDGYQQAYQNYFDGKPPQTIIVQK